LRYLKEFSLPFKGRVSLPAGRQGWGWDDEVHKEIETHPPPNLPLEGGGN